MKKEFYSPEMELVEFEIQDIIVTSGGYSCDCENGGDQDGKYADPEDCNGDLEG